MASRDQVLGGIRRALGRGPLTPSRRHELALRLERPPSLVPARATSLDQAGRVALFIALAEEVDTQVTRLTAASAVPAAVAALLREYDLAASVVAAPALAGLDWSRAPGLAVRFGAAWPDDQVSVTPVFAAIAETGSLVLASGPDTPPNLNFLPDLHIAVLDAARVLATPEEVWSQLGQPQPRVVNTVTGPSRTGDIEQTLMLGAHGPRRLHVLLVDEQPRP